MTKWEYMSLPIEKMRYKDGYSIEELNKLGNEGWGLLCVISGYAYFKREKTSEAETPQEVMVQAKELKLEQMKMYTALYQDFIAEIMAARREYFKDTNQRPNELHMTAESYKDLAEAYYHVHGRDIRQYNDIVGGLRLRIQQEGVNFKSGERLYVDYRS